MAQQDSNERLAALEAKLDIFMDLLTEIRDELKDNPSAEEFVEVKSRLLKAEEKIAELDKAQSKQAVKLAVAGTIATLVMTVAARYIIQ